MNLPPCDHDECSPTHCNQTHFCAWCKRWFVLKANDDYEFVTTPKETQQISHGICPGCAIKMQDQAQ